MEFILKKNSYLTQTEILRLQQLSKYYYSILEKFFDQVTIKFESAEEDNRAFFQYFQGYLMQFDFKQVRCNQEDFDEVTSSLRQISWQPLNLNHSTSASIEKSLYFGRTIYLPFSSHNLKGRVIVISGCTEKNLTNKVCSQV